MYYSSDDETMSTDSNVCETAFENINRVSEIKPPSYSLNKSSEQKTRILLVEDDAIAGKVHSIFLKQMNFEVDLAISGHEALSLYPQGYALILLDLGLPDIDGITVCNTIRHQMPEPPIPIIALTAHGKTLEKQCLAAGINEVILKPTNFEALQERVRWWLEFTCHKFCDSTV